MCRWGDTCWGLVPVESKERSCGCNGGGWQGYGIFYGGYKDANVCIAYGGGFAGPKLNWKKKGDLASVGLVIKIAPLGLFACSFFSCVSTYSSLSSICVGS